MDGFCEKLPEELPMSSQLQDGPARDQDGSAEIPLQPMGETHTGAVGVRKEAVTMWEAHAGAGSWPGPEAQGQGSPYQSRFPGRIGVPMGEPW